MQKKALIIGSGIAGLASAIRLVKKGFKVEIFETNSYPGGKLSEIKSKGYRFDAGPSLFTLPELIEELFILSNKDPAAYFDYVRLSVNCHYFWEDGLQLKAYAAPDQFAREIENKLHVPADRVTKALAQSAYKYEHLSPLFMHRSLHDWRTWTGSDALRSYFRMGKLGIFETMDRANQKLFGNQKLVQLFNRFATYNGSDPYQTPATLNIIPHLEFNRGAFFPKKGMHDITMSLFHLAEDLGVKFNFNKKVQKIITKNKQAIGLTVAEKDHFGDIIVTNMDMVNAYKSLLKDQTQPKRLLKQPKSSSALIFYWGIKKQFDNLGLHNILFSQDYQAEFDHIFKQGTIYEDPTVYINITSILKKDDAPEGCMNWFTMINVPNNQGQDWEALKKTARENIIKKINRTLGTDIEPLIETEEILDPIGIEVKTSSANGALYGNSSNNRYAAFLRHANYSSAIKNLYFCGGSVHPGGGIPLCLLSAKIMTDMIPEI